jgi:hypothetical protein
VEIGRSPQFALKAGNHLDTVSLLDFGDLRATRAQ